jgi:superfamily I DNA and/or RNA helicase
MGVDNLVEGLVAAGMKPLRVAFGGSTKVAPSLFEYTLDRKFELHHLKPEFDKLVEYEKTLLEKIRALNNAKYNLEFIREHRVRLERMEIDYKGTRYEKYCLKRNMLREILSAADVVNVSFHRSCLFYSPLITLQICTTCITSGAKTLDVIDFPVVFLDEASMSTEPASLIPIMKGVRRYCSLP